jgi:hypothetical protein
MSEAQDESSRTAEWLLYMIMIEPKESDRLQALRGFNSFYRCVARDPERTAEFEKKLNFVDLVRFE